MYEVSRFWNRKVEHSQCPDEICNTEQQWSLLVCPRKTIDRNPSFGSFILRIRLQVNKHVCWRQMTHGVVSRLWWCSGLAWPEKKRSSSHYPQHHLLRRCHSVPTAFEAYMIFKVMDSLQREGIWWICAPHLQRRLPYGTNQWGEAINWGMYRIKSNVTVLSEWLSWNIL